MKINKVSRIVRIALTLLLIFMVFKETGIFTALSMFLIFVSIEAITIALKGTIKFG